jgi:PAS domain S-box-containing protein
MPLIDSEGNTIGVLGTYEDITERKNAEEKIRQEQGINNAIINSIPGAFYMLDKNGKYVRWNAYQRDEIIGKSEDQIAKIKAIDTIHPDDKKLVQSKIENVLANGKVETVEGRILLHGGPAFRWLLMTGQQTVIDGNPFLVGIGMDITERKKIEEDLKASQNVLQEKIIDLERFNRISVDRELRMIELKQKIKELEEKLGKK